MSFEESSSDGRFVIPTPPTLSDGAYDGIWPVDPDPHLTGLAGRQLWYFRDGTPVAAEVAGIRIDTDDARIVQLGIRRDGRAHPYPALFAHAPETGEPLRSPAEAETPTPLDIDRDSHSERPLPSGVPVLARAGRPAGLYLFQENLGTLDVWDGRTFVPLGRMPAATSGSHLAAAAAGIAYTTADALVSAPLPQVGPQLAFGRANLPRLRFLSAPCWHGAELRALAERDGRLVLCRGTIASDALALQDLGQPSSGDRFSGPWINRLGDGFWTGHGGFVVNRADDQAAFVGWPSGFVPIAAQNPWQDYAERHHQLGMLEGGYHLAALASDPAIRRLDGPRLAAGHVAYWGTDRFDLPWQAPAETLSLGPHAGALLVPLLALPRDTILLALPIAGPRAGFLRGASLPEPVTGHVLHHAHGAGLHGLPISLDVSALGDAQALLHDGALLLWTRSGRRCHALRVRTA